MTQLEGVIFRELKKHHDTRGWLVELFRTDEIDESNDPVMAYMSQTQPNVVRGPHEHMGQSDYFVFVGPGDFDLFLWDRRPYLNLEPSELPEFLEPEIHMVGESNPVSVIVPPGVIHGYKNITEQPGLVFNAPNRLYAGCGKKHIVDEIRYEETMTEDFRIPLRLIQGG